MPAANNYNIVSDLMDAELPFYHLLYHLPAATAALLAKTDRRGFAACGATARWCAESRRALLSDDLQQLLAPPDCDWDLERMHLCEHPVCDNLWLEPHPAHIGARFPRLTRSGPTSAQPRFQRVWFTFANDGIPTGGLRRLNEEERKVRAVARLLVRHPRLRVRIHGYGQPEAPPQIGEALAQGRAMNVRTLLLRMLVQFDSAWQDEADSDEELHE